MALSKPELSVILPCRDRTGLRLLNCLRSLEWQDLPKERLEIILSDFGSSQEHRRSMRELAGELGCRHISTETSELWNRAKALNIGIQEARGKYVLCTDVDMLFASNFLSTVLEEASRGNTLVLCRCRDLPSDVEAREWKVEDFPTLLERSTLRHALGTGACQATARRWWFDVGGYDEGYIYWGYEDRDMVWRAKRSGLRIAWIHERTAMLHQWHEKMNNDKIYLKYRNKIRYFLTGAIVKKNRKGWGNSAKTY